MRLAGEDVGPSAHLLERRGAHGEVGDAAEDHGEDLTVAGSRGVRLTFGESHRLEAQELARVEGKRVDASLCGQIAVVLHGVPFMEAGPELGCRAGDAVIAAALPLG